jgi:indolepyruvate ferredoxin oxidoreductase
VPAEPGVHAAHSAGEPRIRYHLHPPLLRALGLESKLALGVWIEPLFAALAGARRLRGTVFDPFGWTRVRRLERELAAWYEEVLDTIARHLRAENRAEALEIVRLAEGIRGYEGIKEARAAELAADRRAQARRVRRARLSYPAAVSVAANRRPSRPWCGVRSAPWSWSDRS